MTLSFTQQINGKPNYFIAKIWKSIIDGDFLQDGDFVRDCYQPYFKKFLKSVELKNGITEPKLHTIRQDPSNRWRPGMDIHMVINNRMPNRFQFAPVIKCVSVQDIEIKRYQNEKLNLMTVKIDGVTLDFVGMRLLAINDGFDSVEDFFAYFNKDFKGKLISWTNLKY